MSDQVIYTSADGREIRLSDLPDTKPEASTNTANIKEEAIALFNEGVESGRKNDVDIALEKFRAASELEPKWPYPVYQTAFTLLMKGDAKQALECYRKVDKLEPRGFYTCKQALHTIEREIRGEYPEGLYLYFISHEWEETDDDKREVLREIIKVAPTFAAAYQKLANLLEDHGERLSLINDGLTHEPDAETRGMLLLNKAAIENLQGRRAEAIELLGELVLDDSTTASVTAMAKAVLFNMHQE